MNPQWAALPWQVRLIGEALLMFWRGGTPEVWPHQDTLAESLGKSPRTVQRWLAMAEQAGMIRRAYRLRARGGRVYEISGLVAIMGLGQKAQNAPGRARSDSPRHATIGPLVAGGQSGQNPSRGSTGANKVASQTRQQGGESHTEERIENDQGHGRPARAREAERSRPAGPPDSHEAPRETATADGEGEPTTEEIDCADCGGSGRVPPPAEPPTEACPDCAVAKEEGAEVTPGLIEGEPCPRCSGTGTVPIDAKCGTCGCWKDPAWGGDGTCSANHGEEGQVFAADTTACMSYEVPRDACATCGGTGKLGTPEAEGWWGKSADLRKVGPLAMMEVDEETARAFAEGLRAKEISDRELIFAAEDATNQAYEKYGRGDGTFAMRRPDIWLARYVSRFRVGELLAEEAAADRRRERGREQGTGRTHLPSPRDSFGPTGEVDAVTGEPIPGRPMDEEERRRRQAVAEEKRRREQAVAKAEFAAARRRWEDARRGPIAGASEPAAEDLAEKRTPEECIAWGVRPEGMAEAEFARRRKTFLTAQAADIVRREAARKALAAAAPGGG